MTWGCGDSGDDSVPPPPPLADTTSANDSTESDVSTSETSTPTPDTSANECTSHEDCDDGIECTGNVCTIDGTCVNDLADDVCRINETCMASGTINPDNVCEVCDPTNFKDQWTPRPAIVCDDGDPCTAESHCNKGVCTGDAMESCCGNGILETGETCDGDCKTECVATEPCKAVYEFTGSPETCDVVCKIGPLDKCVPNDGCCPKGCSSTLDNDCEESCGNGVVETGELCDGDCPTACFNSNACVNVSLKGDPATCNSECVESDITACDNGDGCCPKGCTEATDGDCAIHQCEVAIDIQCGNTAGAAASFQITILDPESPDGLAPHGYLFFKWGDENIGFDNLLQNWCMSQTGVFPMQDKTGCVVATYEIGTCLPLDYPKTCQAKQCYSCP